MDGLALLCTLHADGPATLKRLRSAGCPNLTALLTLPITEVALALDFAPAAARRLLREARLLAERVGPELEAEEGPAPVAAALGAATQGAASPGVGALAFELPPVTSVSNLDKGDRALLERIVREGRAARPAAEQSPGAGTASAAERAPAAAPPGLAPAPTALERVGLDLSVECPWPTAAPDYVRGAEREARDSAPGASAPGLSAFGESAPLDLGPLLALAGVDAALAGDLARAGIHMPEDLARADALSLSRDLRVTFAQAKRLCFLARRAAGSGAHSMVLPEAPLAAARVEPATSTPPSVQPNPPAPAGRLEPRSEPLLAAPEHSAAPRARFWEPRCGAGVDAPGGVGEPQGVLVDPSEVDRPRRFSDVRRSAAPTSAAPRHGASTEHASTEHASTGGTILGWDFEIPRPELSPESEPLPARRTWRPLEADESSAGPFA